MHRRRVSGNRSGKLVGSPRHPMRPDPSHRVIDTGINLDHDALKGQAIEVVARPAPPHADASLPEHGTAIAALLVGRPGSPTPGLLPEAKLIAVDAFYRDGGTADRTDVMSLVSAGKPWPSAVCG